MILPYIGKFQSYSDSREPSVTPWFYCIYIYTTITWFTKTESQLIHIKWTVQFLHKNEVVVMLNSRWSQAVTINHQFSGWMKEWVGREGGMLSSEWPQAPQHMLLSCSYTSAKVLQLNWSSVLQDEGWVLNLMLQWNIILATYHDSNYQW